MKTVMNLGPLMRKFTIKEAFQVAKDAGFDGVDLTLCDVFKNDTYWLEDDYLEKARALRAEADAIGIRVLQAHAPFNGTTEYAEELFEHTKRSIEIAAICGAECIVVHPIQHLPYFDDPKNVEIVFDYNMDFYGKMVPIAREYGIKLAIENMWRTNRKRGVIDHSVCSRPEEFCHYVDELQKRYGDTITACLDIGHTVLVGVDPCEMIEKLGSRIGALHIHDNDYVKDLHLIPGHGQMNFEAVHAALKKAGYRGHYTLECTGYPFDEEMVRMYTEYLGKVARHYADGLDR